MLCIIVYNYTHAAFLVNRIVHKFPLAFRAEAGIIQNRSILNYFQEVTAVLTASQVYTYTRRFLDAYAGVMQPLSAELDMAPNAMDILL